MRSPRSLAALQALIVVFIWSTSFILTKWAFHYGFRPLTLSGIRFGLGALLLTSFAVRRRSPLPQAEAGISGRSPAMPIALGLAGYAVNTGGYTVGLLYVPPAEVALLLGVNNTLQVLLWSRVLLRETPTRLQAAGIGVAILGTGLFYGAAGTRLAHPAALAAVGLAGVGYGLWIVGNRYYVCRWGNALELTWLSMASGAAALLVAGLALGGVPRVALVGWLIVGALGVVNTAFAFVLWGHTQKLLKSYESVVINNTQTVQVAILAVIFLGEPLTITQWIAILLVTASLATVLVARRVASVKPPD